jgi:hypothetical protein
VSRTIALPETNTLSLSAEKAAWAAAGNSEGRIRHQGSDDPYNDPRNRTAARETMLKVWPGLADLARRIDELLDLPPYAVMLRNVPVEAPETFFVALTGSLGRITEPYRQSWSRTVHHIRPQTDVPVAGRGVLNQYLHTDGTHWPRRNDLTCLLCLGADQNDGGRTRLLAYDRLVDELKNERPAILKTLSTTSVPWQLDKNLGGAIEYAPVFADGGFRWLKYTIDQAVEAGAAISPEAADAVRKLEPFVESCPGVYEFALRPGDLIIVNNRRCMHARTPIPEPATSHRHLARIKVER